MLDARLGRWFGGWRRDFPVKKKAGLFSPAIAEIVSNRLPSLSPVHRLSRFKLGRGQDPTVLPPTKGVGMDSIDGNQGIVSVKSRSGASGSMKRRSIPDCHFKGTQSKRYARVEDI